MENYENELNREEAVPQPEQREAPIQPEQEQPLQPEPRVAYMKGPGVPRKESPFADSPYMIGHPPVGSYYYGNPAYPAPPVYPAAPVPPVALKHPVRPAPPAAEEPAFIPAEPEAAVHPAEPEIPATPVPPAAPEQPVYAAPFSPPAPPVRREKASSGGRRGWVRVVAAIMVLVLVIGSCAITAGLVNARWERKTAQMTQSFNQSVAQIRQEIASAAKPNDGTSVSGSPTATGDGLTPSQVYAQNAQSVVLITCNVQSAYGQTGSSTGSGFIISSDGYVVTNNHVVEGATSVTVTTYSGQELKAAVVGTDATNDVAVLKAESDMELPTVTIGSSSALIVGDQVVAIGNPLGELTSTMTVGYVSAMDRDVTTDGRTITMIQTDAAINSGNSGGPLFNMLGEVVGITTAKYSGSSSSGATIESIGFAIPIDDVIGLVDDLVNYGYITGAYLGVMVTDMDPEVASYAGLPLGARIEEVTPGYCAEEAGLKAKDIIVDVGGYEVTNISSLSRALRHFEAGQTTTITVFRSGAEKTFDITLDEKPQNVDTATESQQPTPDQMPEDGTFEDYRDFFEDYFGYGD